MPNEGKGLIHLFRGYRVYRLLVLSVTLTLTGCSAFRWVSSPDAQRPLMPPRSVGEVNSGYAYIPIDPFAVQTTAGDSCKDAGSSPLNLLDALPDNAVRMLVESFDFSGNVTYGASKAGFQGLNYRVTVDYINADTINVPIWLAKAMYNEVRDKSEYIDPTAAVPNGYRRGSESYEITREAPPGDLPTNLHPYNIPVYVGVGLRVSANVYVTGANANISGIGVIGAEAEANRLSGSLVVQTLGINGKSIAAALPIQSELNRTTAQNAITSVASIKALLYADETIKAPRVVGLYLPFNGGQALVNALISALSTKRVEWQRPCVPALNALKASSPTPPAAPTANTAASRGSPHSTGTPGQ